MASSSELTSRSQLYCEVWVEPRGVPTRVSPRDGFPGGEVGLRFSGPGSANAPENLGGCYRHHIFLENRSDDAIHEDVFLLFGQPYDRVIDGSQRETVVGYEFPNRQPGDPELELVPGEGGSLQGRLRIHPRQQLRLVVTTVVRSYSFATDRVLPPAPIAIKIPAIQAQLAIEHAPQRYHEWIMRPDERAEGLAGEVEYLQPANDTLRQNNNQLQKSIRRLVVVGLPVAAAFGAVLAPWIRSLAPYTSAAKAPFSALANALIPMSGASAIGLLVTKRRAVLADKLFWGLVVVFCLCILLVAWLGASAPAN